MPDREKIIGHLNDCMEASRRDNTWVFVRKDIVEDALALLKEQEAKIKQLNRFINGFSRDAIPVVRCKDCKHRPKEIPFITSYGEDDIYLEYPKGSKCPCRNTSDEYYSWNPSDDWYCAEGERETE